MLGRLARLARPLVVVALVYAVLAGCGASRAGDRESTNGVFVGRRGAPRVVIAGDSITGLARPGIVAALENRYELRIDAFSGHTIGGVLPALVEQVATRPDIAVVNLGTNDMDHEYRGWRPDLERMLAVVAEVPCVEVFTVYDGRHPPPGANIGTSIDERLIVAESAGSIHLIDWNAAVRRNQRLIVADGIHPSIPGQRWIARAIGDAIATDC
jgi:lysophospholipase L1-like esterase